MALCSDDDQTLEAALSFLDEFPFDEDGDLSTKPQIDAVALVASSLSTIPTEDEEMKRKRTNERRKLLRKTGVYGDPNRARNARRLEIALLKDQIEKLEIDLETLQTQKNHSNLKKDVEKINTRELNTVMQIPSMWQTIAGTQRRRREGSEEENVRLKLIVDRQRKVANNLRSLLKKQLASECTSFMDVNPPQPQLLHVLDFRGDVSDFEALFRLNEAAYREVDAIFTDNGLANMVMSPSDVHIREGVGGKYLELFANKLLPFSLKDTTEAAWDHFKGTKKHSSNGSIYEKAAKNLEEPYTIIEEFTKELYSNSSREDFFLVQIRNGSGFWNGHLFCNDEVLVALTA